MPKCQPEGDVVVLSLQCLNRPVRSFWADRRRLFGAKSFAISEEVSECVVGRYVVDVTVAIK